jgi:hypothetical protein
MVARDQAREKEGDMSRRTKLKIRKCSNSAINFIIRFYLIFLNDKNF